MMETLRALITEQASPQEVLLFVALTVVVCLLLAAVIYVGVMTVLWALRLRDEVPLRHVFLPTWGQFKRYAGEYLLALSTSALLTLTLAAKHDLVEDLKMMSIEDVSRAKVARLFPFQEMPDGLAARLERGGSIYAYEILQPVLAAGRVEEAQVFLETHVDDVREDSWAAVLDRNTLVVAAIVLSLLYLLWLGMRRFHDLQVSPNGESSPSYEDTLRGLLTLAVCIALLLVAPSLVADDEAVAESTLASVKRMPAEDAEDDDGLRREVQEELTRQTIIYRYLKLLEPPKDGAPPENLRTAIANIRLELQETSGELRRILEDHADSERAAQERQDAGLEDLADRVGDLDDRIRGLEQAAEEMAQRVEGTESRIGDVSSAMEDLQRQLRNDLAALSREDATLARRVEGTETRIGDVSSAMEDLQRQLRNDLAALGQEDATLAQQLDLLETRHANDLEEVRSRFGSLDSLRETLAETEKTVLSLQRRVQELDSRIKTTGTLVLFSEQWGQEVSVIGPKARKSPTTPAVLELPPGRYEISGKTVEDQTVQVKRSEVTEVRLKLAIFID